MTIIRTFKKKWYLQLYLVLFFVQQQRRAKHRVFPSVGWSQPHRMPGRGSPGCWVLYTMYPLHRYQRLQRTPRTIIVILCFFLDEKISRFRCLFLAKISRNGPYMRCWLFMGVKRYARALEYQWVVSPPSTTYETVKNLFGDRTEILCDI